MASHQAHLECPILMTHWDPDLYPAQALPLIQELVIQVLAYGEVLLKEVDIFLNPKIRAYLSDEVNFEQFSSLVSTGRIKVLIPDSSVNLNLDPSTHPILATAIERHQKRPLKSRPWRLTREIEKYCTALDGIFGHKGRYRRRRLPPEENQFASKLRETLIGQDMTWRHRPQFKGIDDHMAEHFAGFCEQPDSALVFLRRHGITPNATAGFYRSLAYQCADLFEQRQRRAMKNLVQSVYTYCELKREDAAGTYYGSRIAEIPPHDLATAPTREIFRVEVVPLPTAVKIPVVANIGDIISEVLLECGPSLRAFWALTGDSPTTLDKDFQTAWEHVADAFAESSSRARRARTSKTEAMLGKAAEYVHTANLLIEAGELIGFSWIPDVLFEPNVRVGRLGVTAVAIYSKTVMEWIRWGRADVKRGATRQILLDSATVRCGRVI